MRKSSAVHIRPSAWIFCPLEKVSSAARAIANARAGFLLPSTSKCVPILECLPNYASPPRSPTGNEIEARRFFVLLALTFPWLSLSLSLSISLSIGLARALRI